MEEIHWEIGGNSGTEGRGGEGGGDPPFNSSCHGTHKSIQEHHPPREE